MTGAEQNRVALIGQAQGRVVQASDILREAIDQLKEADGLPHLVRQLEAVVDSTLWAANRELSRLYEGKVSG